MNVDVEELAKVLFHIWFATGHFKEEKWESLTKDDKDGWIIDAKNLSDKLVKILRLTKEK